MTFPDSQLQDNQQISSFFSHLPVKGLQAVEKRPSAAFPLSLVVEAYIQVRLTPQNFACLREAASAKAGAPCIFAFLISL